MAKYRVILDTNIYISAILFGGTPEKVLSLARSGTVEVFISQQILDEILRVLRIKFGWNQMQLTEVEMELKSLTRRVDPRVKVRVIKDDPHDNKFLETAIESKSEFIISGDNHLLVLNNYRDIKIITAREFIDFR